MDNQKKTTKYLKLLACCTSAVAVRSCKTIRRFLFSYQIPGNTNSAQGFNKPNYKILFILVKAITIDTTSRGNLLYRNRKSFRWIPV